MGISIFTDDYTWIRWDDGAKGLAQFKSLLHVSTFLGYPPKKNIYYKAHVAEKYKLNVKRIINNNRNEYFAQCNHTNGALMQNYNDNWEK